MALGYCLTMEHCVSLGTRKTPTMELRSLTKSKKKDENTAWKTEANGKKKKSHPDDPMRTASIGPYAHGLSREFLDTPCTQASRTPCPWALHYCRMVQT